MIDTTLADAIADTLFRYWFLGGVKDTIIHAVLLVLAMIVLPKIYDIADRINCR